MYIIPFSKMITKYYEISCDYCGATIIHLQYKPSIKNLQDIGCICTKTKIFCNTTCYSNYYHDLKIKRVCNLKQYE